MQLVTSEEADGFFFLALLLHFLSLSLPSEFFFTECDYAKAKGTIGKVFFFLF